MRDTLLSYDAVLAWLLSLLREAFDFVDWLECPDASATRSPICVSRLL